MKLRDYQIDLINKVKQAWKDGYKCPCIVAPCGAGKSVILAEMAKRATENKRQVMFIVHRKELCEQINRTFVNYGVNMDYCKIWMVQTLKNKMTEIETPDLLLVDENHHALASTYRSIFDHFKCHRIGVTATPVRLDGSGLKDVNDILLESVSAKWLIENKFLSPAKLFSAPLIDLTGVNVKKGEFDQRQCEQLLDKSVIYGDIIESYRDKADGKKAIIYCVSVDYSRKIQEQFTTAGILTAHIDGTTPIKERDQIINDFKSGKIKVLTNCDIISEGFDVPDCECVMLLRPTKSLTLYIQQAMRSMRYMQNKEAIILDHVGNVFRFGLPWKDREWTLDGKKSKKSKKKDEEDNSFWTCERCFCTWAKEDGRTCPDCDLEIPISEREIKIMETMKLIEITEDMFPKSRKEKRKELKKIQQERGYQKGWVWHRMQDFDKKHEEKIKKLKEELEASTSLGKKNNWCKYRVTQNDKCHDCKICDRINKSLLSNGFISIKDYKKSVDYGDDFGGLKDFNENVIHRFVSLKSFQSLPVTMMNPSQNCVIQEIHCYEGVILRFKNKYRNDHNGFNVLPRSIFRNKESCKFYEKVIYDFLYDLQEHYSTSVRLIVNDKVCSLCDFIEHDLIEEEIAI